MYYDIKGGAMPIVEVHLNENEPIQCQAGGMVWMTPNMQMRTTTGGLGNILKRAASGESAWQNQYVPTKGTGMIAFGSGFPGSIKVLELEPGQDIICQKSAYLASTPGINLTIEFQKKISAGLFGGEGFIMQRLSGSGTVFLEIDGSAVEYKLGERDQIVIDTGHLAIMDASCKMSVESVKGGAKNMMFGGEGFFNTVVNGPGRVVLQTMPKSSLIAAMSVSNRG